MLYRPPPRGEQSGDAKAIYTSNIFRNMFQQCCFQPPIETPGFAKQSLRLYIHVIFSETCSDNVACSLLLKYAAVPNSRHSTRLAARKLNPCTPLVNPLLYIPAHTGHQEYACLPPMYHRPFPQAILRVRNTGDDDTPLEGGGLNSVGPFEVSKHV